MHVFLIRTISWLSSLFQESKLRDEINQLKKDLEIQDDIIRHRKNEAAERENLISGYRQGYNDYKKQRDEQHDERKYDHFSVCINFL